MGSPGSKKKSVGATLKSKGIIPKSWNLRSLTDYKKKVIKKKAKEWRALIDYPDSFTTRKVSEATAKLLIDGGYRVERGRAIIPTRNGKKLKIDGRKGQLRFERTNSQGETTIETVYLSSGPNFLKRLEKLATEDGTLEPNEQWALKVGDNNTFLTTHPSLDQLMRYGSTLNLTDPNARDFVSLVKVKFPEMKPGKMSDLERGTKKQSVRKGRGSSRY
jgi:hypothetical protein